MDHPTTRQFARYALGEINDDAELAAFEDHLMACSQCSRMALAVDLIGSRPDTAEEKPRLHVAGQSGADPIALCGEDGSRNIVSEMLLAGIDASLLCPDCLDVLRRESAGKSQRPN